MKKKFTISLSLAFFFALSLVSAQDFPDLDKSPLDVAYYPSRAAFRNFAKTEEEKKANQPVMRVMYSRPQKKGRNIFGELEKFGNTWRVGANETTEILFFKDVTLNGTTIPAGRYTVLAKLGEKTWDIMINKELDLWGHYAYNAEEDIATISVPVEKTENTIESFSIVFDKVDDGAHMIMGWDDTIVRVPFVF